eukprot:4058582-Pyramimonas_sp.AAC.1
MVEDALCFAAHLNGLDFLRKRREVMHVHDLVLPAVQRDRACDRAVHRKQPHLPLELVRVGVDASHLADQAPRE